MAFDMYRQGQGKRARLMVFFLIGLLGFYLSYSFYQSSAGWIGTYLFNLGGLDIEIRHIGAVVFVLLSVIAIFIAIVKSKRSVDFIIETESEMEKVSWPSAADTRSSTTVVLITILILSVFLFIVDYVFAALMNLLVRTNM